jgi:indole-3-glycerol phosphate synthase
LKELERVLSLPELRLLGINNRNLEDFTTDIRTTQQLMAQQREKLQSLDITVVSESGLYTRADLDLVTEAGARAVLIGESLLKQIDLEQAVRNLLNFTPVSVPEVFYDLYL